jgi:hypothetical protein
MDKLVDEKTKLEMSVSVLKPLQSAIQALEQDIQLASQSAHYVHDDRGELPPVRSRCVHARRHPCRSLVCLTPRPSRYSSWCGSTALRALSPLLYEKVRSMYLDLCQLDGLYGDTRSNLDVQQRER